MNDHDSWSELRDLTDTTGHSVTPLPPASVRHLGTQRRRRRHLAIGAAALALAVGLGGGILSQTANLSDPNPLPPIASRPATAPGFRAVTKQNVITVKDLPSTEGDGQWREQPDGNPVDWNYLTACTEGLLDNSGATSIAGRTFHHDKGYGGWPTATALALQFADAATAEDMYTKVRRGVGNCPTVNGTFTFDDDATTQWAETTVPNGRAEWIEFAYRSAGDTEETPTWLSVGVIQIGDRVAVTTYELYGDTHDYVNNPGSEDRNSHVHEQITLIDKAASRLNPDAASDDQAARKVTKKNLLPKSTISTYPEGEGTEPEWVETDKRVRSSDEISVCQQGTWADLGATSHVGQSFRYQGNVDPLGGKPEAAHRDEPSIYATALQFPDAAAAKAAYATYKGWVDTCGDHLTAQDYTLTGPLKAGDPPVWMPASTAAGTAAWSLVRYRAPGEQDDEPEFFETVGLVRVGDRLTVTVAWNYATSNPYDDKPGDDGERPGNQQYDLLDTSAWALALF